MATVDRSSYHEGPTYDDTFQFLDSIIGFHKNKIVRVEIKSENRLQ